MYCKSDYQEPQTRPAIIGQHFWATQQFYLATQNWAAILKVQSSNGGD